MTLITITITVDTLQVVLDLGQPQNLVASLSLWLGIIKQRVRRDAAIPPILPSAIALFRRFPKTPPPPLQNHNPRISLSCLGRFTTTNPPPLWWFQTQCPILLVLSVCCASWCSAPNAHDHYLHHPPTPSLITTPPLIQVGECLHTLRSSHPQTAEAMMHAAENRLGPNHPDRAILSRSSHHHQGGGGGGGALGSTNNPACLLAVPLVIIGNKLDLLKDKDR